MPENYNGWANRNTWTVALWLMNDYNTYEQMRGWFKNGAGETVNAIPVTAEHFIKVAFPRGNDDQRAGKTTGAKWVETPVNWQEIADMMNETLRGE